MLRYATLCYATLHHTTPHFTQLHYTTLPYSTLHYITWHYVTITLHYTHYTTTHATATTLHKLHFTTTTTPLYYNYNYSCTTSHYIQQLWVRWPTRWPLQPLQPLQKHSSNHLSVHQWIRSAIRDSQQPISPTIGFLFLKLPPPPCAALLV